MKGKNECSKKGYCKRVTVVSGRECRLNGGVERRKIRKKATVQETSNKIPSGNPFFFFGPSKLGKRAVRKGLYSLSRSHLSIILPAKEREPHYEAFNLRVVIAYGSVGSMGWFGFGCVFFFLMHLANCIEISHVKCINQFLNVNRMKKP